VTTFDRLYEQAADFEELYAQIVHELLGAAQYQDIVYAVPGHPLVAEETVRRLRLEAPRRGITLDILPAVSCLDTIFLALGLDPAQGVQVRDALTLEKTPLDTAQPAVLLQVYSRLVAGDVKLHLMELYPPEHPVKLVRAAGLAGEEEVTEFPLYELDRQACDHLSSLYVPPAVGRRSSSRYPLDPLVNVMATLRGPEGCPWDREQTHELLRRYLIEECYEVIEAIDENDMHKLQEELGDLLLQVVFHARLAEEAGCFDINAVVAGIVEKMIRRHPHVFGRTKVESSAEVLVNWQEIKRREKKAAGEEVTVLGGVPRALPALLRAYKIQGRAARVGFDWPDVEGAWTKVAEEIEELKAAAQSGDRDAVAGEVGDLLFAVVNVARFLKVEPELALAATTRKFEERFAFIEQAAASAGRSLGQLTLEEMDELWEQAKTLEKLS
ncbi:MAG TPA: nucleoside triphosphate pyrophosphohydrolase, partial [Firmicutes bacterium]|nr:nucleoside triphosphate pyrophosphohydrolase [Bacillota bacterium]